MSMHAAKKNEDGNILFYILIAVVLLGSLTMMLSRGSGESASTTSANRISEDIKAQAQLIRSAIVECNLVYNNGYPVASYQNRVKNLTCQTGMTSTDIKGIFNGALDGSGNPVSSSDRFLPLPPKPFDETPGWEYIINTVPDPDQISIKLSKAINCDGDAALKIAMEKHLPPNFTANEVAITCDGTTASFELFLVK